MRTDSRIYRGTVAHERTPPHANRFRYGIYFLFVDIEDLEGLDARLRLFGHNRAAPVSLHDRDHGPHDGTALRPWMERLLSSADIELEGGRIFLLTFPRVFGFRFYPVSFWFCHHVDGSVRAVLAEVRNTFGGHHNYLLHDGGAPMDLAKIRPGKAKAFHVSPFIGMGARYEFRLSEPSDELTLSIHDYVDGPLLLVASLSLRAAPLTDRELARTVLRFGPMPMRAWVLIHYQALKLLAKGVRFAPAPPDDPKEDTT